MINEKLENLRAIINELILSEHATSKELLAQSQELDKIIVQMQKINHFGKVLYGDTLNSDFINTVDKIQLFEKEYQAIRLVDPVNKRILDIKENRLYVTDVPCYKYWMKNDSCRNCISMIAINEDDTVFKIEHINKKSFKVIAIPVTILEKKLVIELLQIAPSDLCTEAEKSNNSAKIFTMLQYMKQKDVKDKLTGLFNPDFIKEKLPIDLVKYAVQNKSINIIIVHIDFLKKIRDAYRSMAGERIIQDFAYCLKQNIHTGKDWAVRYDEDKFLICIPDSNIENVKKIMGKIRSSFIEKEFIFENEKMHYTCSYGIHTVFNGKECLSADNIIENAINKLNKVNMADME